MEEEPNRSTGGDRRIEVRIVVQNLQKQSHLGSDLVAQYNPDFLLAQEINLFSERNDTFAEAHFTSRNGYGTAIFRSSERQPEPLKRVRRVESPHAEFGGFIRKKTILATATIGTSSICLSGSSRVAPRRTVQLISFHGYNGQPFKTVSYLVDHVEAVLRELDTDDAEAECAIFAGDFNSWTPAHLDAVRVPLERAGFRHAFGWPYPGREFPLDHVFLKGDSITLESSTVFKSKSDHQGALLIFKFD